MQPPKLFIFAVLVAGCAFYAEGYPAETVPVQPEPADFYETLRNVCNAVWCQFSGDGNGPLAECASALGNGLYTAGGLLGRAGLASIKAGANYVTSEDGSTRLTGAAKTLGNGLYHGAKLVGGAGWAGIKAGTGYLRSEEGNKLMSEAATAVGCGLYTGVDCTVNYIMHGETKREGADDEADNANGLLTEIAQTVGSGLYTAGGVVGKAGVTGFKAGADYVQSDEGSKLLYAAASEMGGGLYAAGGALVKASVAGLKAGANYVRSEEGKKYMSETASAVKSGLYSGALYVKNGGLNGILSSLGACAQFTLGSLAQALISVNLGGLANTLGLSSFYNALSNNLDIYSVLTKLMMDQAQDANGSGTQYAVATLFLQKLVGMVPPLKKLLDALQTVSYVMSKIKQLQSENKPIEPIALMKEALDVYFMDVDPEFKQKLIDLSPLVYQAAIGEPDAAKKIVTSLANRETIVQALKGMGYRRQIELMQMVVGQVSDSATTVKELNAAQPTN